MFPGRNYRLRTGLMRRRVCVELNTLIRKHFKFTFFPAGREIMSHAGALTHSGIERRTKATL